MTSHLTAAFALIGRKDEAGQHARQDRRGEPGGYRDESDGAHASPHAIIVSDFMTNLPPRGDTHVTEDGNLGRHSKWHQGY
jgi:hypothetical protein